MGGNRTMWVGAGLVAALALVGGLFFALSAGDDGPSLSLQPSSGPSGGPTVATLTGGPAQETVTFYDGSGGTQDVVTDSDGTASATLAPLGVPGSKVVLRVTTLANIELATAEYTITQDVPPTDSTTTTSTLPPSTTVNTDPRRWDVSIELDPDHGPVGGSTTVNVTTDAPDGTPVTMKIGPNAQNGEPVKDGKFTFTIARLGEVAGETIRIEVSIGAGAATGTASADFRVTGETKQTTVSVNPISGPSGTTATVTIRGSVNSPVTLVIGGQDQGADLFTDKDGKFVVDHGFTGSPGVVDIEATVGHADERADPKTAATANFTITSGTIGSGPFIFRSGLVVFSDPGQHAGPIGMPDELPLRVSVNTITVEGPAPFVAVSGDLADDGSFDVGGIGTVAGIPDVTVTFEGTVDMASLDGTYTIGAGGELPGGQPIVYSIQSLAGAEPDLAGFYERFSTAQASGDIDTLIDALHPAVLSVYGEDACRSYLEANVNPAVSFTFVQVLDRGPWEYEAAGTITDIGDAYTVETSVANDGAVSTEQPHVALRGDGTLGWFTNCE
ncbi:MAG: hypothetical protein WBP59_00655 [Ilumatobacteraceae bacterium]